MKGIYNFGKEWKLIVGVPVEKFMEKLPQINDNNKSVIDKSIII